MALEELEELLGYCLTDRDQLREALHLANGMNGDANECLAMIGTAAIRLVLVGEGYDRNQSKGQIDSTASKMAGNDYLCKQGFLLGIDKFIVKNVAQSRVGDNVMAKTMKAIVGAVWRDSGCQIAPCANVMAALGISWPE
ncbi:hypothetical protein N7475_002473 [Penicillium sp. IBT 31633x]|nr:hypothetical protein N7475_002473 [Penicillium sp. IBT 31633x]